MDARRIKAALADISAEKDPSLKCLKMASLCTTLWAERGFQLVVVGGSAIEILTEGAYVSGDLDLCFADGKLAPIRERQAIMGLLGGQGGPRSWKVAGMFVDVLGPAESFARTPFRRVQGPYGVALVMKPEDLLVERVLIAVYPEKNQTARDAAKSLIGVILGGGLEVDWNEVRRLAKLPEYGNLPECAKLVRESADELKIKNPFHSD